MIKTKTLQKKYEALNETTRLRIKQGTALILFLVILMLSYRNRVETAKVEENFETKQEIVEVVTDSELFEQDISDELDEKLKQKQEIINNQTKDISQLKELFAIQMRDNQKNSNQETNNDAQMPNFPAPPQGSDFQQNPELQIQPQWVGGIVHEEYEQQNNSNSTENNNQKKRIVKLPPSFMEGFLLTGMDAMTIEGSQDKPEPMMILIEAPAVLPNEVKANLKGCFVIAEGYGNLATHRVDARVKSISCVDLTGNSVIFENIKGFLQDADGKLGIKGVPVHRAGALVARSMIAGMFEGLGDAVTSSAQTTNISTLGQTNVTPSSNLAKAAIGGGISAGTKDVRALFLELARQSSPIIEVGAAKKIAVIITELVELRIQDFNYEN